MGFSIFRPLNDGEKKDMTQLGETDLLDLYLAELSEKKAFYQRQYRPFDYYCARMDFDTKLAQRVDELKTTVDKTKVSKEFDFGDLDQYADPRRFTYIKRTSTAETKLVAGIKQEVKIGWTYHFKGSKGNPLSIFVQNEDEQLMEDFINLHYSQAVKAERDRPKAIIKKEKAVN